MANEMKPLKQIDMADPAYSLVKKAYFKQIGYEPHDAQWQYHMSTARFRLPNCGRRFGKSVMAAADIEPLLLQPNRNVWIVGPTYDLAEKEFREIWKHMIVNLQLGRDPRVAKVYNKRQGNMQIRMPWDTILEVRTAQQSENLVGESLDFVIMSEAAKHNQETWDRYIRPALSDKRGGASFPTTPEGFSWLYDLWMLGKDDTVKGYESWKFPSWMNPYVFPDGVDDEEIKLLRKTMSKEAFAQEIEADFGSFVGKIYPEWDVNKNVKHVEYNPNWPNYITFDWGYTNPLAAVEFQVSPDDKIYVWRLHYEPYLRLEEHVRIMKNREQPKGYKIDLTFGDAADPEAVSYINQHFAPCIALGEAKSNWRAGVDRVRGFIERDGGEDEYGGSLDPVPALFVDTNCTALIKEFNNYKAPQSASGKNVQEIGAKQDDHALDALRYGLVSIFDLGVTQSLSSVYDLNLTVAANTTKAMTADAEITGSRNNTSNTELTIDDLLPVVDTYEGPQNWFDDVTNDQGFFTQIGVF